MLCRIVQKQNYMIQIIVIVSVLAAVLLVLAIALTAYYIRKRHLANLVKGRRKATDATNYYAKRLQQDQRPGAKRVAPRNIDTAMVRRTNRAP